MSYSVVENFAGGVNRTRKRYALEPGTLWDAINGHLTRGGDFEVRKEFVEFGTLPNGTYGFAATDTDLYVFGSGTTPNDLPTGITYQRLQHPDNLDMEAVLDVDLYDGKFYVIARYSDDSIMHFYDGALVADWINGKVRAGMTDNAGIAAHLAALIQADTTYNTSVVGSVITIEAATAGVPFTISTKTENGGATDDQTAVVAETQANVPGVAETRATVSFAITTGSNNPGTNTVSSITISGVEVLGAAVDWTSSNAVTAANVASQINSYNSSPEYTATATGETVTISAAAGTGSGPNGFSVVITTAGNVRVDNQAGTTVNKNMQGGVDAVSGQKQKNTVTIGGTFEPGDRFTITIDDKNFGYSGNPLEPGELVKTHRRKLYSSAGSILNFSGVERPIGWNSLDIVNNAGAGFINMATHQSGSAKLTGLAVYQDKLAIMSRRVIQIWSMFDNEDQNAPFQFVPQTGTRAPHSVREYGDLDVFYLSDSGIRSLRSRSSINIAAVQDVGTPIDPLVQEWVAQQSDATVEAAVAVTEPEDNRFWLAIGTRIFVFTYFPSTKISAWTWYELSFTPEWFAVLGNRLYCRSGNKIYLYGGPNNDTYCQSTVKVGLPFLSFKKDGTFKQVMGFEMAATGKWSVKLLVDPNRDDESKAVMIGELDGVTFNGPKNGALGKWTHVAPVLEFAGGSYASVSKVAPVYKMGEAKG